MAYTPDSIWRNRDTFIQGRGEIVDFLTKKWAREHGYRLRKELFAFTDNKVRIPLAGCKGMPKLTSFRRSPSSSGTSGTTSPASGGGRTGWRTGRLPTTA